MREDLSPSQLQLAKSTSDETSAEPGMIQHFLELSRCKSPLFQLEIGETSQVRGIYVLEPVGKDQVVGLYWPQEFHGSSGIMFGELYSSARHRQAESLDGKTLGEEQGQPLNQPFGLLRISSASECQCADQQTPKIP